MTAAGIDLLPMTSLRIAPETLPLRAVAKEESDPSRKTAVVMHRSASVRRDLESAIHKVTLDGTSLDVICINPKQQKEELNALPELNSHLLILSFKLLCEKQVQEWIEKHRGAIVKNISPCIVLYDPDAVQDIGNRSVADGEQTIDRLNIVQASRKFGIIVFLDISAIEEDTAKAVEAVFEGKIHGSPSIEGALSQEFVQSRETGMEESVKHPFTEREREVLQCVQAHLSNKQIASRLHIAISTVKNHLENMYTRSRRIIFCLGITPPKKIDRHTIAFVCKTIGIPVGGEEGRAPDMISVGPKLADAFRTTEEHFSTRSRSDTPHSGSKKAEAMRTARESGDDE